MSHHANEVFYENLRDKILDTNVIEVILDIFEVVHANMTRHFCHPSEEELCEMKMILENLIELINFPHESEGGKMEIPFCHITNCLRTISGFSL